MLGFRKLRDVAAGILEHSGTRLAAIAAKNPSEKVMIAHGAPASWENWSPSRCTIKKGVRGSENQNLIGSNRGPVIGSSCIHPNNKKSRSAQYKPPKTGSATATRTTIRVQLTGCS
jgi:hypothetical protein